MMQYMMSNDVIPIVNDENVMNNNVKPVLNNDHAVRSFQKCHNEIEKPVSPDALLGVMMSLVNLPKAELVRFDGDPLQYWIFVRAFENNVESTTKDSTSRLMRLIQYCTGKARTLVESCICMELEIGYLRARELLKERFGDDYAISQAWVKRITEGPVIGLKEFVKLQAFSDVLNSCVDTLTVMGYLTEVSTQRVMVSIVARLPHFLRTRWVREVQIRRNRAGEVASIRDLAKL